MRLFQIALCFGLVLKSSARRDAQNVAVKLLVEAVVLQHDVERLIPRHFIQNDGKAPLDRGIQHDVQSADLVNQAEEVLEVNIL